MSAPSHEQIRIYLHLGREQLQAQEQIALDAHLAGCAACRVYAAEVSVLQGQLTRLMRARWNYYRPDPQVNENVRPRLRRKVRQQQLLSFAGSVTATVMLILLATTLGWLTWRTRPVPATPASSIVTLATSESQPPAPGAGVWPAPPGLAIFSDTVKLLGFTLANDSLVPNGMAQVTLYWQTHQNTTTYSVFAHILDENSNLVAQTDMPLNSGTCQDFSRVSPGMFTACLSIPLPLPPGQYQLAVGVYDQASGQRLTTPGGRETFLLTTIQVAPLPDATPTPLPVPTPTSAPTPTPLPIPPDCPVTIPNRSTPPGNQPYPTHHGNGVLWTALWPEGVLVPPENIRPDGWLTFNWWWWRGRPGQLTIEGHRLDAPAPSLQAELPEAYTEAGYQDSWLIFPSEGCWEVTGTLGDSKLTFVTFVVKLGEKN